MIWLTPARYRARHRERDSKQKAKDKKKAKRGGGKREWRKIRLGRMESWGNARRGVERCCRGGLRLCGCCNLFVSEKWWRGQEGELCSSPSGPWRKHTDPGPPPLPTSLFHHHSTCAIYDSQGRSRVARSEDICESSCGGSASLFLVRVYVRVRALNTKHV